MSLTKKDFESLAKVVKGLDRLTVYQFADWCQSQNPRFDRDKFLKACGVET